MRVVDLPWGTRGDSSERSLYTGGKQARSDTVRRGRLKGQSTPTQCAELRPVAFWHARSERLEERLVEPEPLENGGGVPIDVDHEATGTGAGSDDS